MRKYGENLFRRTGTLRFLFEFPGRTRLENSRENGQQVTSLKASLFRSCMSLVPAKLWGVLAAGGCGSCREVEAPLQQVP